MQKKDVNVSCFCLLDINWRRKVAESRYIILPSPVFGHPILNDFSLTRLVNSIFFTSMKASENPKEKSENVNEKEQNNRLYLNNYIGRERERKWKRRKPEREMDR